MLVITVSNVFGFLFLGFYGDWSKLQIFDGTAYDGDAYSVNPK